MTAPERRMMLRLVEYLRYLLEGFDGCTIYGTTRSPRRNCSCAYCGGWHSLDAAEKLLSL